MLLGDIKNAIDELEKLEYPTTSRISIRKNISVEDKMFNHNNYAGADKK